VALKIMPHGRLQEWVAEEKGYFAAEGLEYTFLPEGDYGIHAVRSADDGEIRSGAFETFGAGQAHVPGPAERAPGCPAGAAGPVGHYVRGAAVHRGGLRLP
jgi:hypothetical protein